MNVIGFKFRTDCTTVKYTDKNEYTIKTIMPPQGSLYDAAQIVAQETQQALGFNFDVSFVGVNISTGNEPSATIVLKTGTTLLGFAEIKCPKIDRSKRIDLNAEMQTLPGMEANTIPLVYQRFVELNLAIDVFLAEAKTFVLSEPKREPELFDEAGDGDDE